MDQAHNIIPNCTR